MLQDRDRIFTNLYGEQPWGLDAARRRGDWDGTKDLILLGRDALVQQMKDSGLRGRGGAGFPTALKLRDVAGRHGRRVVVANGT